MFAVSAPLDSAAIPCYNPNMPTNVPMCQRYPASFGGPDRDAHVAEYRTFLRALLKLLNSTGKNWSGKLTYSGGPAVIPSIFIKLTRTDGRAIEILNTPSDDDERALCLVRQVVPSEYDGHAWSGPNHTAYTLEQAAALTVELSAIEPHRYTCAHCENVVVVPPVSRALHGWPAPPLVTSKPKSVLRSLRDLPKRGD